jgi:hypothetical protein
VQGLEYIPKVGGAYEAGQARVVLWPKTVSKGSISFVFMLS